MFVAGYGHFLRTAASLQWDAAAVELGADVLAWPSIACEPRERLRRLVAGFCVAEAAVAREILPFAAAADDPDVAACFEAQAVDEHRHARFFDRVAVEVVGVAGATADERLRYMRGLLEPAFAELFEGRLMRVARGLAEPGEREARRVSTSGARPPLPSDAESRLGDAVVLYHLLLEGIVFAAGQAMMLRVLAEVEPALPGLREGVERVLADERWHVGFGARLLEDLAHVATDEAALLAEAAECVASWGAAVDPDVATATLALHARRLRAARVVAPSAASEGARDRPPPRPPRPAAPALP